MLSDDPSLRGVMKVISFGAAGVRTGRVKLDDLTRPLTMLSDTLDNVLWPDNLRAFPGASC